MRSSSFLSLTLVLFLLGSGAGSLFAAGPFKQCKRDARRAFEDNKEACRELDKGKKRRECMLNAKDAHQGAIEACREAHK